MKTSLCVVLFVALLAGSSPLVLAGQGKGPGAGRQMIGAAIEFIEEHATDLNLSTDQKKQLDDLKQKLELKALALRGDSQLKTLMTQMREARQANDEAKLQTLRTEVQQEIEKKTGITKESVMDDIKKILTQDQLAKLATLHKPGEGLGAGGGKGKMAMGRSKGGDGGDHKAPDPAKGAPSLYDNEKPAVPPAAAPDATTTPDKNAAQ